MTWSDQLFRYCERAQDPAFWAEPFNALSNVGFIAVAAWASYRYRTARLSATTAPSTRWQLLALIALTLAIGVGSFLFHTFATNWSRLADVLPIGLFMIGYLVFALRHFLGCSPRQIALSIAAFLAASIAAATISCPTQLTGIVTYAREPCLKGTMGYAPALVALILTGLLLHRRHPAGQALLLAAGLFLLAMLLRWLDTKSCNVTTLLGRPRGTHALWHLLNAVTLFILLRAALQSLRPRSAA